MKVYETKVNQICSPIGYQLDELSISWKVEEENMTSSYIINYNT